MEMLSTAVSFWTSSGKKITKKVHVKNHSNDVIKRFKRASRQRYMSNRKCQRNHTSQENKVICPPVVTSLILKSTSYDSTLDGWGAGGINDPEKFYVVSPTKLAPAGPLYPHSPTSSKAADKSMLDEQETPQHTADQNFVFTPEQEVTHSPSGYDSC
jgi:hypothetical protein